MACNTENGANTRENFVFSDMYKYVSKTASLSQHQRREVFLKEQKEKRHILVDSQRNICDLIADIATENESMDALDDESVETEELSPVRQAIKFELMKSEWFTEIPDDLEDNWLVKFCPEGFRVLLIAKKHKTTCYDLRGRILFKFKSHFPGGGLEKENGVTALDCVYNKAEKIIFVLDGLYWNTMSLLDSEANFRFYWLKTKFVDNPQLQNSSTHYKFALLDYFPSQRPLIQDEMFKPFNVGENRILFDGVVFYHNESQYTFGYTPLVAWLSSYMLPEKLGIDVLPENMAKRPKDYVCLEQYLENLATKKKKKFDRKMEIT